MMKLSERIRILEEAGIDTSKYNLKISGIEVEIDAVNSIVEDKQVDNKKLFRRWITAQTFKMLNSESFNNKKGCMESGWDAYLRNCYDYKYQFTMMLEELKTLSKLYNTDKDEFNERSHFFNKDVVVATCNHYIAQLTKYVYQKQKDGKIKLAQYGCVKVDDIDDLFIDKLRNIIENIELSENYNEMYICLKQFMRVMNKLPYETPKCSEWKASFKGNGAYYTLKNLIMFHGITLEGMNKNESLDTLNILLEEYKGEYWKFHSLLKKVIEDNNFDLKESIERNK